MPQSSGGGATLAQQEYLQLAFSRLPGVPVSTSATFVANQAYLQPWEPITGSQSIIGVLTRVLTQSGNYDIGIYSTTDDATFTRVASKGSTAVPAAASVGLNFTSAITLTAGVRYFMGFATDDATMVLASFTANINPSVAAAGYKKATSFPLPATLSTVTALGVSEAQPMLIGKLTNGIAIY